MISRSMEVSGQPASKYELAKMAAQATVRVRKTKAMRSRSPTVSRHQGDILDLHGRLIPAADRYQTPINRQLNNNKLMLIFRY
jgi:hypothetical protein